MTREKKDFTKAELDYAEQKLLENGCKLENMPLGIRLTLVRTMARLLDPAQPDAGVGFCTLDAFRTDEDRHLAALKWLKPGLVFEYATLTRAKPTVFVKFFLETWPKCRNIQNILLGGSVGTGKTFAALAFMASQIEQRSHESRKYWTGEFVTATDIGLFLRPKDGGGNQQRLSDLRRTEWLLIDDLPGPSDAKATPAFIAEMEALIHARHSWGKRTIITTNVTPSSLEELYGPRFWSRLSASLQIVVTSSTTDLRQAC
jgi:hypothetical protein